MISRLSVYQTISDVVAKVGPRLVITSAGCWEFSGGHDRKGYPSLSIGGGVYAKLHRLACSVSRRLDYYGDWTTLHSCPDGENKGCWNPGHLRPGTNADNIRDTGKVIVSDHHDRVVSLIAAGVGNSAIARAIGVQPCTITNYRRRKAI